MLGLDPQADGHTLRERVGVQLQETHLQDKIKVWEALDLYASFYPHPADWKQLLQTWGLGGKRDAPVGKLSGGQKQRLFIALALVGRPEVVFLDELTSGLDPQARRLTWGLVKQVRDSGVTVVLVSHFMDEAEELCDRVAIFDRGRIAALDSPEGLIDRAETTHRLLFRPSSGFNEMVLSRLPGVTDVTREGGKVVVTGSGDFASFHRAGGKAAAGIQPSLKARRALRRFQRPRAAHFSHRSVPSLVCAPQAHMLPAQQPVRRYANISPPYLCRL